MFFGLSQNNTVVVFSVAKPDSIAQDLLINMKAY